MSTTPKRQPPVSFRAAPDLLDAIRERAEPTGASDGDMARSMLGQYLAVLALELRNSPFSAEEAALVCDALNGVWLFDSTGSSELVLRSWWANVEDHIRLNDAARKWGVKEPAVLVSKCRAMSPGMSAAIIDAVSRFWHMDFPEGASTQESLCAVGLVQREADSVAR